MTTIGLLVSKSPDSCRKSCGPESRGFDRCLEDNLENNRPDNPVRARPGCLVNPSHVVGGYGQLSWY